MNERRQSLVDILVYETLVTICECSAVRYITNETVRNFEAFFRFRSLSPSTEALY